MRSVVVVEPPGVLAVSLEDAKRHLRVDFADDDALITGLIHAAQSWIDAPDGWLGRALVQQTLELRLDNFGEVGNRGGLYGSCCGSAQEIDLPFPPLVSVTSVKYDDGNGVEQTIDPALYRLVGGPTARLLPVFNTYWPATRQQQEAVRIRFVAGYGPAATDVPGAIRHALMLLVGHFYENREAEIVGARAAAIELPTGVNALLSPFRVYC